MPELDASTRRTLVRSGTLGAGVLLLAALLVMVNYFGGKYYKRFDWTETRLYSLSEKTRNVLEELERDVDIVVFLSPQDDLYEPVRELLRRYEAASPRIAVRTIDPERNPIETEQLVRKYEITAASVVVASGDDKRVIDSSQLADMDFSALQFEGGQPRVAAFKGEQAVSSAILHVAEGRKPKVLVTTGHGEARLDDVGARGLSAAQQLLTNDNFEIEEWAPLGKSEVPAGTDVVVVAGPTAGFVPPELELLAAFVARGGRLLILLDPALEGGRMAGTGLERWLTGFGAQVGENVVIDPDNPIPFFGAESFYANRYGDHPIVRPLSEGNLPVFFRLARSVSAGSGAGFTATNLVETTEAGWGEVDLAALDRIEKQTADFGGPVPIGVAVEVQRTPPAPSGAASPGVPHPGARLVVFGDSDFATNQLQKSGGNSVLLTNALNWLVEREALIGIPPKKTEQVHLNLTGAQLRGVVLLAVLGLPGLAVAAGIWISLRRRR